MNHQQLGRALAPDLPPAQHNMLTRGMSSARFRSHSRLAGIGDALSEGSTVVDVAQALLPHLGAIERVGSRVTCDPAPVGTDEDWLVLLAPDPTGSDAETDPAFRTIRELGFSQDGCPEFYTGNDAGGFRSWRRGEVNLVTTRDPAFHDLFLTATELCRRFNLLHKPDRIALFQAVLYGVPANRLEE